MAIKRIKYLKLKGSLACSLYELKGKVSYLVSDSYLLWHLYMFEFLSELRLSKNRICSEHVVVSAEHKYYSCFVRNCTLTYGKIYK